MSQATNDEAAYPPESGESEPGTAIRGVARVGDAARLVLGAVLLGMVAVNVLNALGRYLAGISVAGADELLVQAMVWMVMTGAVVVSAERRHLCLDVLPARLGRRARLSVLLVTDFAMAAATAYAAVQSLAFVQRVARIGQVTMGLGIPAWIPHAALLMGFALTALVACVLVVNDIRALGAAEEDR